MKILKAMMTMKVQAQMSDVSIEKPGTVEVRNAVETLMNFSLFSISDKMRTSTIEISRLTEMELVRNLKQASIKDFLQK